ncbi:MBL fold metallo-hydrolase [Pseudoprimorskyibacter insulae]|uniref:Putative quorum-quenching lactonase YtnP n=1 Tax=Pseudoprimorskyibacter insulae TaxID=1695997 RepID=A0A2R8AQ28_9RHOB|nr:MBL fold metallo-hydrolase [Pseudoprimorskyibacter insulae]SPF78161.1 putative quorum-quenching lactonase YtnP [Pseudoprimorskyibacter insulae]
MMYRRKIGDAEVFNIVEMIAPTHDPAMLYPALGPEGLRDVADRLTPDHFWPATGKLIIGIQIWVVKLGEDVIVIDTGVGNGKPRGLPRFDRLNTLAPVWLSAIGATPEAVTHVINTHLHGDHVGGNTVASGDGWTAAFPNARYWMPQRDYDYWLPRYHEAKGIGETEAFTDGVMPLVEAGKVTFYGEGQEIVPGLTMKAAYGHTPGMMRADLTCADEAGVFCADIFHSPLQILRPDINTVIDVLPEVAQATRMTFLAEMADTGALVMPCHFGAPHAVRIVRDGDGFGFVPDVV